MMVNLSIDSTAETPAQAVETHASWHGNTTMEMEGTETPAQGVETHAFKHGNTATIQHVRQEEEAEDEEDSLQPKPPRWMFPPPRTHDRTHDEDDSPPMLRSMMKMTMIAVRRSSMATLATENTPSNRNDDPPTMVTMTRAHDDKMKASADNDCCECRRHNQSKSHKHHRHASHPPLLHRPKPPMWLFPPPRTHDRQTQEETMMDIAETPAQAVETFNGNTTMNPHDLPDTTEAMQTDETPKKKRHK
jgi:hypothetical protein